MARLLAISDPDSCNDVSLARRVADGLRPAAVIYACETYAAAMLEKLAQWNGILPDNQHFVEAATPRGASYEVATPDIVPGWDSLDRRASRRFAASWYAGKQSLVLFVPFLVARMERNVVVNGLHPGFQDIQLTLETPVWWDRRLYRPQKDPP